MGYQRCKNCNGLGQIPIDPVQGCATCPNCGGSGYAVYPDAPTGGSQGSGTRRGPADPDKELTALLSMICGGAFGYFTVAGLGWQVWWQVALAGFGTMALSGFIIQRNHWILSFTRLILKIIALAIVAGFILWLANRQ